MGMKAIGKGNVAVITGGASGIGLAAAHRFAAFGMSLVIVDMRHELFDEIEKSLIKAGAREVICHGEDVASREAVARIAENAIDRFKKIDVLMCNAGIQPGSEIFDGNDTWRRILDVNLWGIVNCCQIMAPAMSLRKSPALIINTGSKQGITTPPGDPAYNISKAGVKIFTESLQHHLRKANSSVSARLFIPGFVFTDLTRRGRSKKPPGAWTADQSADFLFERLKHDDFYILCPDNDVTRELDEKRMDWAMDDIIRNRPPLSRWHPDWSAEFDEFSRLN
ncbi:MAG: SDR family NAD(P)-dependent oxidoreductase [Roseovarius sp.]|nr:SDR family NAD(P)-dependent oxidoreductase [Roseovarius sp.]